jgi:hypothetical protein
MGATSQRNSCVLSLLSLLLAAVSHLLAQDVRIETQQQARTREQNAVAEEDHPEKVADPELGDINLVSRQPRPRMFTSSTSQSLNFSSNAFLVRDGEQSDLFWNGRVGASFVPYATRNFTPRLTFDQSSFRYRDFGQLDFDSQSLQLDLKYDLNRNGTWFVNGSYALARLYAPRASGGEFYRYGFLDASITHLLQLGPGPINLGITGGAYWRHGDPSLSDRVSGYLNLLAVSSICQTVQLSGFTRQEVQHYTHDASRSSRQDFNVTVGATLSWTPNEYLAFAATASYTGNFSTIAERSYDLVTPSLIFAAQIAF